MPLGGKSDRRCGWGVHSHTATVMGVEEKNLRRLRRQGGNPTANSRTAKCKELKS